MKLQKLNVPINQKAYYTAEPEWDAKAKLTDKQRNIAVLNTFNWYSKLFGPKEADVAIEEYLLHTDRKVEAKQWKKVKSNTVKNSYGWYARMITKSYPATTKEVLTLEDYIKLQLQAVEHVKAVVKVDDTEAKEKKKAGIQETMREKANELGGELEYLLDCFIDNGCKNKHDLQPIKEVKLANILPQHIPALAQHWEGTKKEFQLAYEGTDDDIKEGYSTFTKTQLKNLVKFCELVIADLLSYVQYKKASKAPRKRKTVTPLQQVNKLKYARKNEEFRLVSVKPEKIIGAKEMYVFDPKKRKIQRYVADDTVGSLSVKNNTIIGFDPTKTVMKTARKPKEQVRALMKQSRPNTRKYFNDINAVEAKMSGRFNENLVILKVF